MTDTNIVSLRDKIDNIANDLSSKVSRDELDILRNDVLSTKEQLLKLLPEMDNLKKTLIDVLNEMKNKVSRNDNVLSLENKYNYATIDQFNALGQVVQKISNTLQNQPVSSSTSFDPEVMKRFDGVIDTLNKHSNHLQQLSTTTNVLNNKLEDAMQGVSQYKLNELRKSETKTEPQKNALLNQITQSQPLFNLPKPDTKQYVTPNPELKTDVRMPPKSQQPNITDILTRYNIQPRQVESQVQQPQVQQPQQYLPTSVIEKNTGSQLFNQAQYNQRVIQQSPFAPPTQVQPQTQTQSQTQPQTQPQMTPQMTSVLMSLMQQSSSNPQFVSHIASLLQSQQQTPTLTHHTATPQVFAQPTEQPRPSPISFPALPGSNDTTKNNTIPNPLLQQQRNLRLSPLNTPFRR